MLVLSRRSQESITITTPSGEVIIVYVIRIDKEKCRIGVQAPQEVQILRTELIANPTGMFREIEDRHE